MENTAPTPETQTIWVMESELCDECDALLDYFGECPNGCKLDDLYVDEDEGDGIDPDEYALDFDEQGRYIGG